MSLDEDGLITPNVGIWNEKKYKLVQYYAGIFATSMKNKWDCRTYIDLFAGAGRSKKPFMKAGNKHHALRSRGKLYPRTSGVSMNAVDHPFGGSNLGLHKTVSRHRPPGRKVGSISPKRTGKRKRK